MSGTQTVIIIIDNIANSIIIILINDLKYYAITIIIVC